MRVGPGTRTVRGSDTLAPMTADATAPAAAASPARAGAWLVVVLGLLLPRLWRFEAVGEGVDEAYSVKATRALLDGRFSYRDLNDFSVDAYQAKLTPVAELTAVPFVVALGDRPLSFRLPSLLASLGLGVLVVAAARRLAGRTAAVATLLFVALDYRGVSYAQTHRYVAVEQLLLFGAFLAALRAGRTGRVGPAVVAAGCGLAAVHAHLLAVLVLAPTTAAVFLAARPRDATTRRRPLAGTVALALVCAHGGAMLLLFRALGLERFFPAESLGAGLARGAGTTARAVAGLGPAAVLLGLPTAVLALRSRDALRRAAGVVLLGAVAGFALGSLRLPLAPRYLLAVQPFAWLLAGVGCADLVARWDTRPRRRAAVVALAALPGAALVAWYLGTGGGRDAELTIHAALRRAATPGEAVLWDVPAEDPYGRRPDAFPAVPHAHALWEAADPDAALDARGVRWVVRSSRSTPRPLWTPQALSRLEAVATSEARGLLGEQATLTLYRRR